MRNLSSRGVFEFAGVSPVTKKLYASHVKYAPKTSDGPKTEWLKIAQFVKIVMRMKITMDTVKIILHAIGQRHDLNPAADTFEFELGGLGVPLNNENDYRVVIDALTGLQDKAGIKHEIEQTGTLYESFRCKITIADKEKFANLYTQVKSLPTGSDSPVEFDDNKGVLVCGDKRCQLPPYKNEHYFCRAVFEYPVNEPVDWSLIFERISGHQKDEEYDTKKAKRKVYDAMEALNERVEEVLGVKDLFIMREKTITRTR